MKKIENNFAVTGFVGKDAEIRQFTTASVARFSLAIARNEKNGKESGHIISKDGTPTAMVVATNEELLIALDTEALVK